MCSSLAHIPHRTVFTRDHLRRARVFDAIEKEDLDQGRMFGEHADSARRLNLDAERLTVPNIESRCNQPKLGHPR